MSDNDLIRRGDVRTRVCLMECAARWCESKCNLMDAVDATPPIDAIEVVRCRDCMVLQWCRFARGLGLDGFCSQGERREKSYERK